MNAENLDRQALAMVVFDIKAAELRKANPKLTREQAFAKVYADPSNSELLQAEREGSRANLAKAFMPIARTEPAVAFSTNDALDALKKLAAEQRSRAPWMSTAQAFAAVYEDPANRQLVTSERAAAREQLYSGGARIVA